MSNAFRFLAVWLAVAVLITGSLTALRVRNASQEDMLLVVAMNRIRAAYVAIDPTIAEHLVTGWSDDAGVTRTYVMGLPRHRLATVFASAFIFAGTVNAIVAASLGAVIAGAAGAPDWATLVLSGATGVAYFSSSSTQRIADTVEPLDPGPFGSRAEGVNWADQASLVLATDSVA
jgi:hypothetical protein